jgi:hypothetical protein
MERGNIFMSRSINTNVRDGLLRRFTHAILNDLTELRTRLGASVTDFTAIRTKLLAAGVDLGVLRTPIVATGTDVAAVRTKLVAAGVDLGVLRTPIVALVTDVTNIIARLNSAMLSPPGLGIAAGKKTATAANPFVALVDGTTVYKALGDMSALVGTIADGYSAAWAFYIDAAGTITTSAKTADAADEAAAIALIPAVPAHQTQIGYLVVDTVGATFVGGTTDLDAVTATDHYYDNSSFAGAATAITAVAPAALTYADPAAISYVAPAALTYADPAAITATSPAALETVA